jgi:hypothetical protein
MLEVETFIVVRALKLLNSIITKSWQEFGRLVPVRGTWRTCRIQSYPLGRGKGECSFNPVCLILYPGLNYYFCFLLIANESFKDRHNLLHQNLTCDLPHS